MQTSRNRFDSAAFVNPMSCRQGPVTDDLTWNPAAGNRRQNLAQVNEDRLRELLLSGLAGDGDAYRRFLTELSARLRAYFRRRLRQLPDDVEDLVQETLLAVHTQRHTYAFGQPLTAWVHAIAKYKLIDFLRRRSRHEALTDPLDDELEVLAHSDVDASDARRDLAELMKHLPERQRVPILLVKLQGLSVVEAARKAGMSVSAVKVGVHRGLKALAARLRESR